MLLVVIISSSGQFCLQSMLAKVESNGKVINIAGRQRMLSQRIARNLLTKTNRIDVPASQAAALKSLEQWVQAHQALREGRPSEGIPIPSVAIAAKLRQLQSLSDPMLKAANEALTKEGEAEQAAALSYLETDRQYVEQMDQIVKLLETEAQESIQRLQRVEIALFLCLILCIAAEAAFIFLPTYWSIMETFDNLTRARTEQQEINQKLENALQAKSQFLANISHELRTPLNGILGTAELMGQTQLTANQKSHLATIKDSGQMLKSIINDVLDFSQLEDGQIEISAAPIQVKSLMASIAQPYQELAAQKSVKLVVNLSPNLAEWCLGDGLRLGQILMNLLGNAVKFTHQGEIEFRASNSNAPEPILEFSVRDTGVGIDPTSLDQIFESFFQVDYGTSRKFGGVGLGLSISNRLANLMSGKLSAKSQLGIGTTFSLSIPLVTCDAPELTTPQKAASTVDASLPNSLSTECPLRILVAEDNSINQMVIRSQLESLGYDAMVVDNGSYALDELNLHPYDLLLLDLHMPVLTGFQLLEQLCLKPVDSQLRIVAWSATVVSEERQRALDLGCHDFLAKPYDMKQLINTIKKTWDLKSSVNEAE